ncbi:MAG: DUF115 domain-containing protein [Treponema sp.]|jgi:hypothetical protein|nr:DUF115 domain-containing protein [Treponema sp.]
MADEGGRDGEGCLPVITPARRGNSLKYKSKTLLSTVEPAGRAEKAAEKVPQMERTLYFCPSPLFGYGLEQFLSRLNPGSAILCVETDEKLLSLSVSQAAGRVFSHPRLLLTGEKNPAALCALVRKTWGGRAFRRVIPLKLNGGWQLDAEVYAGMEAALADDIAIEWGNAMTLVKLGRRYARNTIRNLSALCQSRELPGFFNESDPVLVLGAGPSLDGFLNALAERVSSRNREVTVPGKLPFRIICVDTCIPVLLERGIRPDLAVVLESQFWNVRDFIGGRNSRIPAAFDLSAYPATTGLLGGETFFFLTPWTGLALLGRIAECFPLPVFPPLGSVGLTAVALAKKLTKGPILAAGMDFSFTLDATHARGSPGHAASLQNQNRFRGLINAEAAFRKGVFQTVSKTGVTVFSNPAMRTYRNLFQEEFSKDKNIHDIRGTGLPLGLAALSAPEALDALFGGGRQTAALPPPRKAQADGGRSPQDREKFAAFAGKELGMLRELREILSGGRNTARIPRLLSDLDYLWSHFPEYAGAAGKKPSASDTGFLKRVRAEIDPFRRLWELLLDAVT